MNNLKTLSFRNKRTLDMFIPPDYNNKRGDFLTLIEYLSQDNDFRFSDFNYEEDAENTIRIFYSYYGYIDYELFERDEDKRIGYTKYGDELMKLSPYNARFYFQNQIDFMSIYDKSIGPSGRFANKYNTTYKSMFNISEENKNTMLWISEEKE